MASVYSSHYSTVLCLKTQTGQDCRNEGKIYKEIIKGKGHGRKDEENKERN
jgi:hypothetical protein